MDKRYVIDTNVVFEGLTKKGGASDYIVRAWLGGLFRPMLSNALAYEYADVLSRKLSARRWEIIHPTLSVMIACAEFMPIRFTWRPASPDPGDDHLIDLGMNAGAAVVTFNVRDFSAAHHSLGLTVWTPVEFVTMLARSYP